MGSDGRPVCHRCAQIKQACDGNLPCARCVRLSLPCRPRNASGTGEDALAGEMPKARIRRVQTGCLMCKRRKKKCDESKPRCGDCRRLCLDCAWPPERYAKFNPSGITNQSIKEELVSSDDSIIISLVPTNSNHHSAPGLMLMQDIPIRKSPSPSCTSSSGRHGSYGSQSPPHSFISHDSQLGYASYANFNRPTYQTPVMSMTTTSMAVPSSAGIPVTSPVVGESTPDLNTQTLSWDMSASPPNWLGPITPTSNGSPTTLSMDPGPPSQSLSIYIPQLMPQLTAPQDKALLNHYSTIVSSILSRRASSENPYNGYLLPMAQSNDLVLHCILALSANHWRKLQPGLNDRGLLHKSKATQALARVLPHVDKTSADVALVSSLLLCMTELFDGTSEGWKLHLKGAKRLLITLKNQQGDIMTGHYKFLLRLARFLDSAATTSTCRPPLMGDEAAQAEALDSWSATPDEDDSAVYGIPKALFHLVDRVNTLAELRSTRVDQASETAFRQHAADIVHRINNWPYEYGGTSRLATSTPMSINDDVLHATTAFEYAIRLRLHQIVEGYEMTDPKVGKYVDGIVECVQQVRYGSPLESCLLFPLVMAGGSCWKLEHRVIIQDRLLVMERTCGFGYIYNARDLVERVWSRRDQSEGTGAIVNWAKIRYYEMHGLVVF